MSPQGNGIAFFDTFHHVALLVPCFRSTNYGNFTLVQNDCAGGQGIYIEGREILVKLNI